jgi:Ca-activated chloride channel family protein
MPSSKRCLALAASLVLLSLAAAAQPIRVTTQSVPLYVTVIDAEKRLVPGLTQDDFEIYDNGKLQTITTFANEASPVTVIVMLDTSGSMTLALDLVKDGAEQFIMRMLPIDKGMVGAFNDKIEFHPDSFTDNRDQLARALKELDFGYPTRLYDAIDQSIEQLSAAEGRKVVLVFTDGADTASKVGSGDVLERARAQEVMVYSIGLENEFFNGQQKVRSSPDRSLRRLSEETGGGHFLLRRKDDLGSTFTRVAQELHSQYILGFTPQLLDGKVHKLEIRLKKPGLTARARRSYVAGRADTNQK